MMNGDGAPRESVSWSGLVTVRDARAGARSLRLHGGTAEEGAAPLGPRRPRATSRLLLGPRQALALVVLAAALCRLLWLDAPDRALIFDEAYYVNAARVMLGWRVPAGAHYAGRPPGRDPNPEHPPLGKAVIALSMRAFGDVPLGWRAPSIVAGAASVALTYGVVGAAGGGAWLGVLGAALLALDNLSLVHGRIATLDMPLVACLLLAAWLALRRHPVAAGAALGCAALFKLTGVYGLPALLLFGCGSAAWAWRDTGRPQISALRSGVKLAATAALVWIAGLWLLDLVVGAYRTPWEHLRFMVEYGLRLTNPQGPQGQESLPWQWLLNEVPMTYLRTDQQVLVDGRLVATRPLIVFRGAMNPFIVGAAPLALGHVAWRAWRHRDRLALWCVTWIAATYLPYFPLAMIHHRVSYIFYFLPTLPALVIAIAMLVRDGGLPRVVLWAYLAMAALGFVGYFPFQSAGS
jgi:predicted membrane-bound dolichyl-phosphate-mannose-protein mannosyltransferase